MRAHNAAIDSNPVLPEVVPFFDQDSNTFSYLVKDPGSDACAIIDSVMAFDTYPAEIRGFGRCVTHSRIGEAGMTALSDRAQVLISLDDEQSLSI